MTVTTRSSDQKKRASGSSGRTILRILWTSFKILIIPVLCITALIIGLAIGYVVLGDKPLSEVFDAQTWKHMYDLVFAEGS
ncbi:DNA-directed RNA polymerase subunit beta [Cohnella yongneupensis]|uniref:DNA-directed RNA polymerase subunit beta n=1 Tax=Cohnella yongneupensis TaxID=425006 RepID=A0ABW0R3J3_9BACL